MKRTLTQLAIVSAAASLIGGAAYVFVWAAFALLN